MDPRASASAEHDSVESGNISQWLKPPDPLSSVLSVSPDAIPSSFPSDFIKFLALAQKMELDFIPITWQPSLPRLGFGGTAELSQSFLSLQTSLAFKRVNLYKRDDNPAGYRDSTLKRIMAETWALSIPQIRDHPSVVQIEGVCWELDPSGGYFWPVLVYDKAERGDLSEFSNSHSWKDLCSEERLRLCFDIGDAIMTMHNNGVIYGDLKPENILIFPKESGRYVARLTDFGYSTSASRGPIKLPLSRPWHDPHYTPREVSFSIAQRMEIYAFGLVVFWVLFQGVLFNEWQLQESTSHGGNRFKWLKSHIQRLKDDKLLPTYAKNMVDELGDIGNTRKHDLRTFFDMTVHDDLEQRAPAFTHILPLIQGSEKHDIFSNKASIKENEALEQISDFKVSHRLYQLSQADYRLRTQITGCLQHMADHPNPPFDLNVAFQLAFCLRTGLGIIRCDQQAFKYLEQSKRHVSDLDGEIKMVKEKCLDRGYSNVKLRRLHDEGTLRDLEYAEHYKESVPSEAVLKYHTREIQDLGASLGTCHEAVMSLRAILALVIESMEDLDEAEKVREALLQDYATDPGYGINHTSTLTSANLLASLYSQRGKYREAENVHREVLKRLKDTRGPTSLYTLNAMNNLAMDFFKQCKYSDAENLLQSCLHLTEASLGSTHKTSLATLGNLAIVLRHQGSYDPAFEMQQRAVNGSEAAHGKIHQETLSARNNLALILQYQKRYEKAEEEYRNVLELSENFLGDDHLDTLSTCATLAACLYLRGKYDEAETIFQRALKGKEAKLGSQHHATITLLNNLSLLYCDQGKYGLAESYSRRALQGCQTQLGVQHLDTLSCSCNLAKILEKQDKDVQAEQLLLSALEMYGTVLGNDDVETLTTVHSLARLLQKMARYEEAQGSYKVALRGMVDTIGCEDSRSLNCAANYCSLLDLIHAEAGDKSGPEQIE